MSSPADHTDTMLEQDPSNTTFQHPPARLNPEDAETSMLESINEQKMGGDSADKNNNKIENEENDNDNMTNEMEVEVEAEVEIKNEAENEIKNNNDNNDIANTTAKISSQEKEEEGEGEGDGNILTLLASTQPIAESASDDDVNTASAGTAGTNTVKEVQYKGQPVWQLNLNNGRLPLIKRMTDMMSNWSGILSLIKRTNDTTGDHLSKLATDVETKYKADINGDYWLPNEYVIELSKEYHLEFELNDLINIGNTIKTGETKNENTENTGNTTLAITSSNKRSNSSSHELESPAKKGKHSVDVNTFPIFQSDVTEGNPNFPFTLKPLTSDNILNEQSKVIMSSLFLPYQSEVTLSEILKRDSAFLTADEEKPLSATPDVNTNNNNNNNGDGDGEKKLNNNENDEDEEQKDQVDSVKLEKEDNKRSKHLGEINIDVSIDDNGQTALHLAATLGKVSLVEELIQKGANRFRGDNDGQTALIRVVHATNCFELSCFDKLLDLLYPSIRLLDNRGRSILHHIALTCGLKGRYDASKYYLETLLEWVVKKGSKLPNNDSSLTLTNFIKEVVNKSDKYGNTCLNYATLAGNKYVVSQLLDICADPNKANKIGVAPGDWGIDVNNHGNSTIQDIEIDDNTDNTIDNDNTSNNNHPVNITANNNKNEEITNNTNKNSTNGDDKTSSNNLLKSLNLENPSNHFKAGISDEIKSNDFKESTNSLQLLDSIQSFISNLGSDFKQELVQKSQQIDKLNPILREKTLQLSQKRKQYDELQKVVRTISKISNKIDNLNKAINEEETAFQKEIEKSRINIDQDNCLGDFDADQPFTILPLYHDIEMIVENLLAEKIKAVKDEKKIESKSKSKSKSKSEEEIDDEDEDMMEFGKDISSHTILDALNSIKSDDILPYFEKDLNTEKWEVVKESIPPTVVLDARIRAYKKNNEILMDKMNKKRNSNKELESQFKRIIGLCIGTDSENIDDRLLSSLLMSVETDPDPEIGQIKKVLKIVGDLDGEDGEDGEDGDNATPATANTVTTTETTAPSTVPSN